MASATSVKPQAQLVDGIYHALSRRPRLPPAQASNFLPLTARLYEPLWRHRSLSIITRGAYSTERELELMQDWLNLAAEARILDAACSAGLYARTLKQAYPTADVHAVDFSLPFLRVAQRYAERDGTTLTLVQADVNHLPYPDHCFDAVVTGGSLNELLDLPAALSELSRVLKPDGLMWHMYLKPAKAPLGNLLQGILRLSGIRFIEAARLEQLSSAAGLRLTRSEHRDPVVMSLFVKD